MPGYNYTDYANIDEDAYVASNGPINKMRGGVATLFPQKLHKLIDQGLHADIISWAPHGRCFLIHQPKLFVQVVLPHFFNATKKTSFTRQLNLYGFVRLLSNGPDKGGYYHEKFLRSKSKLCKMIKRIPKKGSEHTLFPDSKQEPKFHSMPYLPIVSTCREHSLVSDSEQQEPKLKSMSYVAERSYAFSCDKSCATSTTLASSLSTSRRSITKSNMVTSSMFLEQLKSNYEQAKSSFAKKVTSKSKDNRTIKLMHDTNLNAISDAFDDWFRSESLVPKASGGDVIFQRLPLSDICEGIIMQHDHNRAISLDTSTFTKRAPRKETSMKSTISRNKEPSSIRSGFDSKTKCFISQFF